MKKVFAVLFVVTLCSNAFADDILRSSNGAASPIQHLSCDSTHINIDIEVRGNAAVIESDDLPGHYTCSGTISNAGAELSCNHTGPIDEEAPQTFELHAEANKSATFSFSGSEGASSGQCIF
jgi:hypothetical protein